MCPYIHWQSGWRNVLRAGSGERRKLDWLQALARITLWVSVGLLWVGSRGQAATLQVGPTALYTTPSQAAAHAQDGDIIEIAAGRYVGNAAVAVWKANNLTIRGVGGRAHLDAQGVAVERKGIWVIKGNNTTIEQMEFSGAKVPDGNGAGIRQEGKTLTLRSCYIHDNEMGILTDNELTAVRTSDILIESSEFARNGGDNNSEAQNHNIYIGAIRTFTLQHSYSHGAIGGQLVKSRAETNYILYNRLLEDSLEGITNYDIDLSNGGVSYVVGNIIKKAKVSTQPVMLTHAPEAPRYTEQALYVINNTFVNEGFTEDLEGHEHPPVFIQLRLTPVQKIVNNLFVGGGTVLLDGATPRTMPPNNLLTTVPQFVKAEQQDYRLTTASPARDAGQNADCPAMDLRGVLRPQGAGCDLGALEFLGDDLVTSNMVRSTVGDKDTIHPGDAVDTPPRSQRVQDILAWIGSCAGQNPSVDLDTEGSDRPVGFTHYFLLPPGARITAATLTFRAQGTTGLFSNDSLLYEDSSSPTFRAAPQCSDLSAPQDFFPLITLHDLLGRDPQGTGAIETTINLGKVPVRTRPDPDPGPRPGGSWVGSPDEYRNLLPLLADGQFDVIFGDDAAVDWSELTITYVLPDTNPGDLTGDKQVDLTDLKMLMAVLNTPASAEDDPRDLDGDGQITVLDMRKLILYCTRSRCAMP